MQLRHLAMGVLYALLSVPSLRAQVPTVGTINTAQLARQASLPPGAAPQGLTATASSPTSVRLTWTPAAGATGYYVYRGASPDASVPPIATVPPPAAQPTAAVAGQRMLRVAPAMSVAVPVTYLDAGVMPKSTVYYRIAATYDAQQAGFSQAVSATTPIALQPTGFLAVAGPGSVPRARTATWPLRSSVTGAWWSSPPGRRSSASAKRRASAASIRARCPGLTGYSAGTGHP